MFQFTKKETRTRSRKSGDEIGEWRIEKSHKINANEYVRDAEYE
jgi:hypothetical protein